jgi:hypothetical protein
MTKNEIKEIALNNGDLNMDNLMAISGLDEETIRYALVGTWHQYGNMTEGLTTKNLEAYEPPNSGVIEYLEMQLHEWKAIKSSIENTTQNIDGIKKCNEMIEAYEMIVENILFMQDR